ncbi:hypothetical protein [Streptomyces hydrogenans]
MKRTTLPQVTATPTVRPAQAGLTDDEKIGKLRQLVAENGPGREIFTILLNQIDKHGDVTAVLTAAEKLLKRVIAEESEPIDPDRTLLKVTAPGTDELLLGAEIYTPESSPSVVAVWNHAGGAVDLDVAGTDKLISDLEEFIPRLRAMRAYLAAEAAE